MVQERIDNLFYFRFISQKELDELLKGNVITSPDFGYIHTLTYRINNNAQLPLTIKQAVSFMVGTISTEYLVVLKNVQVIGTGIGNYANYLTIDETGNWKDIRLIEYHLSSYSKDNVVGIFTGDFYHWKEIARLDLENKRLMSSTLSQNNFSKRKN